MISIETLQAFGANTAEGVARCVGNEAFYLRMVNMAVADGNYERLAAALGAGDLDAAFEAAHALKGVLANLALTPILEPVKEITELLRARTDTDYTALLETILEKQRELAAL